MRGGLCGEVERVVNSCALRSWREYHWAEHRMGKTIHHGVGSVNSEGESAGVCMYGAGFFAALDGNEV